MPPPPASPLDRAFLVGQPDTGELILVRHGQQDVPAGPMVPSEWVDPPLSEVGRRQADLVGRCLAAEAVDALYSSHLRRAHETGRQVGRHHGIEPTVFEELREIEILRDLPPGKPITEAINPTFLRGAREMLVRHRTWDAYPFSESTAEFRYRVVTMIEGILTGHRGQRVVIACHGGVINAYVGHFIGATEDMFFRPAHASISRVRFLDMRRAVLSLNETHHLAAEDPDLVTF